MKTMINENETKMSDLHREKDNFDRLITSEYLPTIRVLTSKLEDSENVCNS